MEGEFPRVCGDQPNWSMVSRMIHDTLDVIGHVVDIDAAIKSPTDRLVGPRV